MKTNAMKRWVALVLSLSSLSALAGENCNFELQAGVRVDKASLEFTRDEKPLYKILKGNELWINGRQVQLNPDQQKQLGDYADSIRSLVPQVRQLTLDAVDLATGVVDTMYTEIAEPNSSNHKKLLNEFASIKRDLSVKFAPGQPFYFNEEGAAPEQVIDREFEARINQLMDSMGSEIAWDVMKKVGVSIFSQSKMSEFEASMEKFGQRMDAEMGERSKKLGQHADSFCQSMKAVDQREETLKHQIKELSSVNFIKMKPADTQAHEHLVEERRDDQHTMHAAQGM